MALLLDNKRKTYRPYSFQKEKDFESVVVSLADQIFGPTTIYVDVKKKVGSEIVTIPDGYLIDMTEPDAPKLFVLENEIVRHDPFQHIGVQMLKFVTSFDESKRDIRNFIMDELQKNREGLARLNDGCAQSTSRNIDNYLDLAVYSSFRGIVIIDEARPELYQVLEKINANISVIELRTYISDDNSRIHQFNTLYEEFEEAEISVKKKGKIAEGHLARRKRKAESDTIIVPAREEGFKETFLGEDKWYAIRIGAAMKERIRYIAAYQVAPVSAVTHIAEVQDIRPYKDTGKYIVHFKGSAREIPAIKVKDLKNSPQGPVYAKKDRLLSAKSLEDALST